MKSVIIALVVAIVVLGLWVVIIPRDATAWIAWAIASVVASVVAERLLRRVLR